MKYLLLAAGIAAVIVVCGPMLAGSAPVQGAARFRLAGLPAWGPDIRVNPPVTGTADIKLNFMFAVNPRNPQQVLAPYQAEDSTLSRSGYAWSTNAGRTWDGKMFYGPWISDTIPAGNPSAGFDSQGTAYYASAISGNNVYGYVVLTSTMGGIWSAPLPIVVSDSLHYRDQARLAVDARPSGDFAGSLYIAWRYSSQTLAGITLRYSRDGGRTWSAEVPVSDAGHETAEQPVLAVAVDGRVYAAFGADDTNLYLDQSTDGGATWGLDHTVAGDAITPIGALDPKGRERMLPGGQPDAGFLVNNDPRIAVAPAAPQTVYAVWNDGRWDSAFTLFSHPGRHGDIAFSRSTDAGVTWSAPLRINDDLVKNGVDQWAPNIAVGPDGRIGVTWYDRRDDPAHLLYHLYYSESTDGGQTWSANVAVSDVPSDPMAVVGFKGNGFLGDYAGLVFAPDYALASWVDSRGGRVHDFYADRGTLGAVPPSTTPTAIPSAVPTLSPTATPCANAFSDVHPTDYFAPPVLYLACHGVISGYADGTFRPYTDTTRAQMVKIVVLGLQQPITTPAGSNYTFSDVPPANPFFAVIEIAAAHNLVSGYACGGPGEPCDPGARPYFRPYADVTRGQLAKVLVAAKGWAPFTPPTPTFADVAAGSPFYGFVERAVAQGVLSGYSCGGSGEPCPGRYFRPAAPSTRGQLAKILYNVLLSPP